MAGDEQSAKPDMKTLSEELYQDSLQALVSLGYSKQAANTAIHKVVKKSQGKSLDAESLVRASLKCI